MNRWWAAMGPWRAFSVSSVQRAPEAGVKIPGAAVRHTHRAGGSGGRERAAVPYLQGLGRRAPSRPGHPIPAGFGLDSAGSASSGFQLDLGVPMRLSPRRATLALAVAALAVLTLTPRLGAQCVSLTTLGAASTQNFDTLSNTAGSTTNNLTITGWFMTELGGGTRDNEQYAVDTGASTTGDTYSYGAAAATDRALGALLSGTLQSTFGVCFTNNTGSTVTNLAIAYTGEEWRLGNAGRTDRIDFQYSLDATSLTTGTW